MYTFEFLDIFAETLMVVKSVKFSDICGSKNGLVFIDN